MCAGIVPEVWRARRPRPTGAGGVRPDRHAHCDARTAPRGALEQRVERDEDAERDGQNAVDREERGVEPVQVAGPHDQVLVEEEHSHDGDAEPVPGPDVESGAGGGEQRDRAGVHRAGAAERPVHAESRGPRVETRRAIVVEVEQRVEQVEAGNPEAHRAPERPRLPRKLARDRHPGADRRQAEASAEPEVAKPRDALQIRVDDEQHDGDRPEPADDRLELEHRDEIDEQREEAERPDLHARERTGRKLPRGGAWVPRVDLRVDEAVQPHRERPGADHRDRDPGHRLDPRPAVDGEQRADVRKREREDRVLEPDEPREPDGKWRRKRAQTGSFVFETSSMPSIRIALSTAFAMSYTVSAATAAAVSASISTPVCAVVSAAASIATPWSSTVRSTSTTVSARGWQSGISSPVRFAAWIPAIRATVSASPFGSVRSRAAVDASMATRPRATARRRETGLAPTSTIRTSPVASSTWESSLTGGSSARDGQALDGARPRLGRATPRRPRTARRAAPAARRPRDRRTGTTSPGSANRDRRRPASHSTTHVARGASPSGRGRSRASRPRASARRRTSRRGRCATRTRSRVDSRSRAHGPGRGSRRWRRARTASRSPTAPSPRRCPFRQRSLPDRRALRRPVARRAARRGGGSARRTSPGGPSAACRHRWRRVLRARPRPRRGLRTVCAAPR